MLHKFFIKAISCINTIFYLDSIKDNRGALYISNDDSKGIDDCSKNNDTFCIKLIEP